MDVRAELIRSVLPLRDDYKPPVLLFRDEQLRQMFQMTVEARIPHNLWLQGEQGLGKTLTCQFFADEVEARGLGKVFFLRCERSMRNAMMKLCERYRLNISKKFLSPSAIASAALEQTPDGLLAFVIDEPESSYSLKDVVSFAHTLYNTLVDESARFAIIFASRMLFIKAARILSADSRLKAYPISFAPYSEGQIRQILRQRLEIALAEGAYDPEALSILAKHIWRVGSDLREALKIMRRAVEIADARLTKDVMLESIEYGKNEWWRNQILDMPPHWALLLYLAAKLAHERNQVKVPQSDVIDEYAKVASGYKKLGRATTYYILNDLAKRGFFKQEQGKGFGNPIYLVFDEDERDRIVKVGGELAWCQLP